MDSTLNRAGKLLYTNVLYFAAARSLAKVHETRRDEYAGLAEAIRQKGNLLFWPENPDDFHRLLGHVNYPDGADTRFPHPASVKAYSATIRPGRQHYVAHVEYARYIDRCDVLANVLAVLVRFASRARSDVIMRFLTVNCHEEWATLFPELGATVRPSGQHQIHSASAVSVQP